MGTSILVARSSHRPTQSFPWPCHALFIFILMPLILVCSQSHFSWPRISGSLYFVPGINDKWNRFCKKLSISIYQVFIWIIKPHQRSLPSPLSLTQLLTGSPWPPFWKIFSLENLQLWILCYPLRYESPTAQDSFPRKWEPSFEMQSSRKSICLPGSVGERLESQLASTRPHHRDQPPRWRPSLLYFCLTHFKTLQFLFQWSWVQCLSPTESLSSLLQQPWIKSPLPV